MVNTAHITFGPHLERSVPRYASYPTVASFHEGVGSDQADAWIAALPEGARIAASLHVPFCPRLCWYCMCRTEAARSDSRLDAYLDGLIAELARTARLLPPTASVTALAWRGGSPASLGPARIARLAEATAALLPLAPGLDFAVEIDAAADDAASLDALAEAGMTRALLSVQDIDPEVQRAIGRVHGAEATEATFSALARRGIAQVSVDHLYGLPCQSASGVAATARLVARLGPSRVTLTGYAHLPALAKRQRMIREAALPDTRARLAQFEAAGRTYREAGYCDIGIDHLARPEDPLAAAAASGRLRRGFEGYRADDTEAHIGFGAGAVSRLPQGLVQNAPETRSYLAAIEAGRAAGARGVSFSLEDRVRGRAIDMLMCAFRLDLAAVRAEFGDFACLLDEGCARALDTYRDWVSFSDGVLAIVSDRPVMARLVARLFDVRSAASGPFGLAV